MSKAKQFKPNQQAENEFARQLRRVAKISTHVVEMHTHGPAHLWTIGEMKRQLEAYAKTIEPWAARQSAKMLEAVQRKNKAAFLKQSKEIGKLLKTQVHEGEAGRAARDLMAEQVELIKSIPLRAAERAQSLALEAQYKGMRASEISEELQRTGKVNETNADRIARTEVARANAVITQARAQAAGSSQYIWRNSGDQSVRESHRYYHGKKLDGMIFSWDSPPTLDDEMTGHPGTFPNCRCYAEPFFPTE